MDRELKEYLDAMEDRLNNKFIVALADIMEVIRNDISEIKEDVAINREVLKTVVDTQNEIEKNIAKIQEDIEDIKGEIYIFNKRFEVIDAKIELVERKVKRIQ